jgi:hypothetical protein
MMASLLRSRAGGEAGAGLGADAVAVEVARGPGDVDDAHLAALTRMADVLVVAVGYPALVRCAFSSLRMTISKVPFWRHPSK